MSKENRFGKWGAWVAAAGIAIGGGHEISKDETKSKIEIIKDRDVVELQNNLSTQDTVDQLKEPRFERENLDQVNTALKELERMNEQRKKDIKKFLEYNDHQIHQKLSQPELDEWHKKIDISYGDNTWEELQSEMDEKRKKGEELATNNQEFNKIKKTLEQRFPNAVIFPKKNPAGNYSIQQPIYYEKNGEIGNRWVEIFFDFDKNGFFLQSPHSDTFLPWSASDDKTFLQMLEKQIQANLLYDDFYIQSDEISFSEMLKTNGIFDQYKDVVKDQQKTSY